LTVAETLATALERHVAVREPLACGLRVGAVAQSEAAVSRRVDELVELMGLGRYRDAFVFELSTGTRRIVELACAVAHRPTVLLLDEPSSGIAQRESEALGELLVELKDETGATLAVIEHDIPLISALADELVCLDLGRVIAWGTPADVLSAPEVLASYLGTDEAAIARSGRRPRAGNGARRPRSRAPSG
jgi:branched-chain amino acid transport system ATP-binding protein